MINIIGYIDKKHCIDETVFIVTKVRGSDASQHTTIPSVSPNLFLKGLSEGRS